MDARSECPKCGAPRAAAEPKGACPSCGLRLDLWSSFDGAPASHPALDAAFATLNRSWADPSAHDAFLSFARTMDGLDLAAGLYRQRLREQPEDAQAQRGLQLAVQIVTQQHATAHSGELMAGVRALHVLGIIVAAGVVLVVGLLLYLTLRR